jgi:hypothetical protein
LRAVDLVAALLVGSAALGVAAIAWTGEAGPFGAAALFPAVFAALALPAAAVAVGLRLLRRRPAGSGAPAVLVVAAALLVAALVAVPVGDRLRRSRDERAADAVVRRVDGAARGCAGSSVAAVPDEVESNPGVAIRPQLTARFARCLTREEPDLGCTPGGCATTLVQLEHARRRALVVDPGVYLDAELRRRTNAPYDRTGRWRPARTDGTVLLPDDD